MSETEFDYGPCCVCEKEGADVRNLIMLHKRAPLGEMGWGCFVCGLPNDGALAVICDTCLQQEDNIEFRYVIKGYPDEKQRFPFSELSKEPFDHDLARHKR